MTSEETVASKPSEQPSTGGFFGGINQKPMMPAVVLHSSSTSGLFPTPSPSSTPVVPAAAAGGGGLFGNLSTGSSASIFENPQVAA